MTTASPPFRCRATSGDNHLGGDDWDQRIVNWLIDQVKAKTGADLSKDAVALQRLKEAAEQAKKELSSATSTNISLQYLSMTADGPSTWTRPSRAPSSRN